MKSSLFEQLRRMPMPRKRKQRSFGLYERRESRDCGGIGGSAAGCSLGSALLIYLSAHSHVQIDGLLCCRR